MVFIICSLLKPCRRGRAFSLPLTVVLKGQVACCQHPEGASGLLSTSRGGKWPVVNIPRGQVACCQHPEGASGLLSTSRGGKWPIINIPSGQVACCQHPEWASGLLSPSRGTRDFLTSFLGPFVVPKWTINPVPWDHPLFLNGP